MVAQRGDVSTLERGSIYFFYRPKVGGKKPEELHDIEQMYMLLTPDEKKEFRLAVIGHKRLPAPSKKGRRRFWGFVDMVTNDPEAMAEELKSPDLGEGLPASKRIPAARPVGEGVYRIIRHEDHTHLVYALEEPREPGVAQDIFNVEEQASYILAIKNPKQGGSSRVGLSKEEEAEYPENLQKTFHGEDFGPAEPPDFLDYEGTQFVLISASANISKDLGITLNPDQEQEHSLAVFKELDLEKNTKRVKPLFEGKLV